VYLLGAKIKQKFSKYKLLFQKIKYLQPIPVAAGSKAWICGRCLAVGSNPTGDMDVCLV
jgi:hypothetical protein